jgi:hypothetical protein
MDLVGIQHHRGGTLFSHQPHHELLFQYADIDNGGCRVPVHTDTGLYEESGKKRLISLTTNEAPRKLYNFRGVCLS